MNLQYHRAGFACQVDLASAGADALHLLRACGHATQIAVPGGWASLAIALEGEEDLRSRDAEWRLRRGEALVWPDGSLRMSRRSTGSSLLLCGPVPAWRRSLGPQHDLADAMMPYQRSSPRPLLRMLVHMTRLASHGRTREAHALLAPLCAVVIEHQADLQARLQRCAGRTLQRRRQTLRRLLRVRHLVWADAGARLDVARLADSANYSACHLIRVHREAFGETPTEYASRLRLQRAWQAVCTTPSPVCEISEALGFESQSAFCRAFKKAFGMTTGQARAGAGDPRAARGCAAFETRQAA